MHRRVSQSEFCGKSRPLLCSSGVTDPSIEPLVVTGTQSVPGTRYLQTSPEFAMKRLLAAGSGPIYQVCKAFRDGEAGRLHNPEFSLLEWYRPGYSVAGMMAEVAAVLGCALHQRGLETETQSYAGLFASRLGIDVFAVDAASLSQVAVQHQLSGADGLRLDRDGWLDLLMSHLIQPALGTDSLCFVTDYPASQAALARRNPDRLTAARFEVFLDGVELANGFDELTDADEQAARFEAENEEFAAAGLEGRDLLECGRPYLALAGLLELFHPPPPRPTGVSDRAWVDPGARLGREVAVGPFAVVEEGVELGLAQTVVVVVLEGGLHLFGEVLGVEVEGLVVLPDGGGDRGGGAPPGPRPAHPRRDPRRRPA